MYRATFDVDILLEIIVKKTKVKYGMPMQASNVKYFELIPRESNLVI